MRPELNGEYQAIGFCGAGAWMMGAGTKMVVGDCGWGSAKEVSEICDDGSELTEDALE